MITTLYSGWSAMFGTWQNLLEYFLKFLPTTSMFKTFVMNTERYIRLKGRFQCKNSEAYFSYICFAAQEFEAFLRRFQFEQTMIYMLYPFMVEMIWSIMTKFIKKKCLVHEDGSPKRAEDSMSINPLISEVSSIDFLLVLITLKECIVNLQRFVLQKPLFDAP